MGHKPLVFSLSPLGMSRQEEDMLKKHGCVLAYTHNLCLVTCPAGTTRKPVGRFTEAIGYWITFPNGTQVKQEYRRTWRFCGLSFGQRRTAYLVTRGVQP